MWPVQPGAGGTCSACCPAAAMSAPSSSFPDVGSSAVGRFIVALPSRGRVCSYAPRRRASSARVDRCAGLDPHRCRCPVRGRKLVHACAPSCPGAVVRVRPAWRCPARHQGPGECRGGPCSGYAHDCCGGSVHLSSRSSSACVVRPLCPGSSPSSRYRWRVARPFASMGRARPRHCAVISGPQSSRSSSIASARVRASTYPERRPLP